jgi:hypothetical protein
LLTTEIEKSPEEKLDRYGVFLNWTNLKFGNIFIS